MSLSIVTKYISNSITNSFLNILCKEFKNTYNFEWFSYILCELLFYILKNPTIFLNVFVFVFLKIDNAGGIFLEHYFYTMDSFDSYTIMYDMFDLNFTWEFNSSLLPLRRYKVNTNPSTSNTNNSGSGSQGGSGPSGPNGGSGPSGPSGPSGGNNPKQFKPSTFFSSVNPRKYGKPRILTTEKSIQRDAEVKRVKKIALERAKEQAIKKHNMEFYNNNNSIFAENELDAQGNFIRTDNDHLYQEGLLLNLYRKELIALTKAKGIAGIRGKYEDVFPEDNDGRTNIDIFFLHAYHKQVSKEYCIGDFGENINIFFLKKLNKDIDTD